MTFIIHRSLGECVITIRIGEIKIVITIPP